MKSLQHCLTTLYHCSTGSTHPLHLSDSRFSLVRPVPRIFMQLDYTDRYIPTSPSSNAKRVLWNESVRCTRVSHTQRAASLNAQHIPPTHKHFGVGVTLGISYVLCVGVCWNLCSIVSRLCTIIQQTPTPCIYRILNSAQSVLSPAFSCN